MPMFGSSRKRAASNPALRQPSAPPSSSASLAATRAFSRDPNANAQLSSAAAAAALRTLTPTPTPVGDTVTKRMVRKGSLSSQGSGSVHPPNLRRHSSSGSMTERSFRDKSPSRSSPVDRDAPPVPQVPKTLPSSGAVHRRASSLEPRYRGGSPAGRGGGGRGMSLDRGFQNTPGRGQARAPTNLSKVTEMESEGNGGVRSSVNFSRPMSPQQTPSPTAGRNGDGKQQSGWFVGPVINEDVAFRGAKPRPKTSQGLSSFEIHNTQQQVQNAADRPVSTRRSQMAHGVEGARLATGSMRVKPSGSAVQARPQTSAAPRVVDPKSPFAVYDPSTRTFIHKGDAIALHKAMSEEELNVEPQYESQRSGSQRQQYEAPQAERGVQQATPPQHVDEWVSTPQRNQQDTSRQQYDDGISATSSQYSEHQSLNLPATNLSKGSPILERQLSEDLAGEDVRPAREANTGRKLEISVPDSAKAPAKNNVQSPQLAKNLDGPYPLLQSQPAKSQSNPAPSLQHRLSTRSERNQSLSPPRNAHFAPVATELNGVKHQPLPRSVSPAKSALKPSPSTSRRSYSPVAIDTHIPDHGAPPSETSDAMSDGETRKKKKNVRVSFEEAPVIAGVSAYAEMDSPYTPTGLLASRWSTSNDEDELDDYSKPRPVLPSFGSIRDQNRRSRNDEGPEKVTETVSSSLSASASSAAAPVEMSSDHLAGGLLAKEFAANAARNNDPLPPEVTTVEGTGYGSDSDKSDSSYIETVAPVESEPDHTAKEAPSMPEPEPKTLTNPVESKPPAPQVPDIAIQPASPSPLPVETKDFPIEKVEPKVQRHRSFVPGGWDEEEESDKDVEERKAVQAAPTVQPESVTQSAPSTSVGPSIRFEELPSRDADTESSDNDSIYSDAYEDLTDAEGGFGSIDAVVESPVAKRTGLMASQYAPVESPVTKPTGLMASRYAPVHLPSEQGPPGRQQETGQEEDKGANLKWDATREHWSRINESRKAQSPMEHPVSAPAKKQTAASSSQQRPARDSLDEPFKPTQKSSKPTATAQPRKSALKKPTDSPQARSSTENSMRRSMRDGPTASNAPTSEPRFRKSMRDGPAGDTQMRKSMRGPDSTHANSIPPGLAASRYSMTSMDTKPPKGTLQKRNIPAGAAVPGPAARNQRPQSASAPIRAMTKAPAPTYDSDSDASASSFQRQRPRRNRQDGGRYTMRASMRSGAAPASKPAPAMRSISPPVASSQPPPTMKRSMRPTSPTPESPASARVKSSRFSIRSLSPAGRFRKEKAPPSPVQTSSPKTKGFGKAKSNAPAPEAPKARFKSRFADSSDEDDDAPRRFQSRFADSDDSDGYELPPDLTPVRGIPRKAGDEDGDSTDLEDEASDTETPAQNEKPTPATTNGATNGQGSTLAAGSLRDGKYAGLPTMEAGKKAKTKRGFFGLGKKKQSAPSSLDVATQNGAASEIPMPPEHRNRDVNRDLNRPLSAIGEDAEAQAGGTHQPPRSPKLQRRGTPQWGRSTSDSWPLPGPTNEGADERPQTSDGVANRRPTLVKRHSSRLSSPPAMGTTAVANGRSGVAGWKDDGANGVVLGRSGKKKKFQGLRRVFGLND